MSNSGFNFKLAPRRSRSHSGTIHLGNLKTLLLTTVTVVIDHHHASDSPITLQHAAQLGTFVLLALDGPGAARPHGPRLRPARPSNKPGLCVCAPQRPDLWRCGASPRRPGRADGGSLRSCLASSPPPFLHRGSGSRSLNSRLLEWTSRRRGRPPALELALALIFTLISTLQKRDLFQIAATKHPRSPDGSGARVRHTSRGRL